MKLEEGKTYKTRGGWDALVIWKPAQASDYATINTGVYAIHKPKTHDESSPMWHHGDGKVADCVFGVNMAPCYEGHPADIIGEKSRANK